jgi:uncharacterized protein YbbK (DUF523 family)
MPIDRPRVVVSRCLGFEACRWDGRIVESTVAQSIRGEAEVITVCPEAVAGLGVPRDPINLVMVGDDVRAVQAGTGRDVTDELRRYARKTLDELGRVDTFILKSRSPSCGLSTTKLLDSTGEEVVGLASGVFADEARQRYPSALFLDEERLDKLGLEDFLRLLKA